MFADIHGRHARHVQRRVDTHGSKSSAPSATDPPDIVDGDVLKGLITFSLRRRQQIDAAGFQILLGDAIGKLGQRLGRTQSD